MTPGQKRVMLEYLAAYQGKWTDIREPERDCDVCTRGETYQTLRQWIRGDGTHEGYATEPPDLCLDHGRELGVVW